MGVIPRLLLIILTIISVFGLPTDLVIVILLLLVVFLALKIIDKIKKHLPLLGILLYQHLSEHDTFFKLLTFYTIFLLFLSPMTLGLWITPNFALNLVNDVFILSIFGIFVDLALYLSIRLRFVGTILSIVMMILGIVMWNTFVVALFLGLIEGLFLISNIHSDEKNNKKVQLSKMIVLGLFTISILAQNELLALFGVMCNIVYFIMNSKSIYSDKPEITIY